jgi:phosphatidate cytidylyltransferase
VLLRTVSGLLGLTILLTAIWAGLFWVFVFTLLAAILGIREFYRLHPPASASPETAASEEPLLVRSDKDSSHQVAASTNSPATEMGNGSSAGRQGEPANETAGLPDTTLLTATPLPTLLGAAWVAVFIIGGAGAGGVVRFWGISLVIFAVGAFLSVLWLIAFYRDAGWPAAAAYLLLGPIYVGFLLAHVMLLAQVGDVFFELDPLYFDPDAGPSAYEVGRNWLMFALLVNFATDSGAYLVGRAIGRHPMAPATSPNKTWEGAFGGFVCAAVAAFLLDRILDLGLGPTIWDGSWFAVNWQPLVIGATVGIVSQFGDLLESRLKRRSQVKDSGTFLPGHGGALDRLDSLLLTLPTVYYLLVAVLWL